MPSAGTQQNIAYDGLPCHLRAQVVYLAFWKKYLAARAMQAQMG